MAAVIVAPSSETKAPRTIAATSAITFPLWTGIILIKVLQSAAREFMCLSVDGATPNSAGTVISIL